MNRGKEIGGEGTGLVLLCYIEFLEKVSVRRGDLSPEMKEVRTSHRALPEEQSRRNQQQVHMCVTCWRKNKVISALDSWREGNLVGYYKNLGFYSE